MSNFKIDLEYSMEEGENELFNNFYYRVFTGIENIHFAKDMKTQRKGIDKVITFKSGNFFTIDEKKRRKDYGDILLELWSVDNKKRGWLYTSQCDYIVYAVMPTKKVYLLPTILLKMAWKTNQTEWNKKYKSLKAKNENYITTSIAIPTKILLSAISNEIQQEFRS